MTYYLYGPDTYTPDGRYPLVVLLHGGGERADPALSAQENSDVLLRQTYVTAFTTTQVQRRWPCFVVVPQAPVSDRWVAGPTYVGTHTPAPQPAQSLELAMEIVRMVRASYSTIDADRIYVGGISMGGFGTWEALERWPETFAAAFPIAGAGDPQAAGTIARVPLWAFHGSADALVPVQASRVMVQAVRAAGGMACYTEYAGANHDVWFTQRPLSDSRVLAWLFSQSRATSYPTLRQICPGHSGG